jgi:hypothetical protein
MHRYIADAALERACRQTYVSGVDAWAAARLSDCRQCDTFLDCARAWCRAWWSVCFGDGVAAWGRGAG